MSDFRLDAGINSISYIDPSEGHSNGQMRVKWYVDRMIPTIQTNADTGEAETVMTQISRLGTFTDILEYQIHSSAMDKYLSDRLAAIGSDVNEIPLDYFLTLPPLPANQS